MNNCQRCNGLGFTAVRSGDDDQECPCCKGTGNVNPAPVVVQMGSYQATVQEQGGLYHLSLSFLDTPEKLTNSFCHDHHMLLAMGRALVNACNPTSNKWIGYAWDIGQVTFTGWITFRGRTFPALPDTYTAGAGYELGVTLLQLGLTMEMQRRMALWLSNTVTELRKAG